MLEKWFSWMGEVGFSVATETAGILYISTLAILLLFYVLTDLLVLHILAVLVSMLGLELGYHQSCSCCICIATTEVQDKQLLQYHLFTAM
jgi:hypothetical protein